MTSPNLASLPVNAKIHVAGHNGMVGSAVVRKLQAQGQQQLLLASRQQLDLTDAIAVNDWYARHQPEYVIIAAAKVGGIHANNSQPAEFIGDNLRSAHNLIDAAWRNGVKRLLFLGSSCIYPRMATQPIVESELLNGVLEPTNEPYAIAKIAGIKLCESYNRQYGTDFRSLMPTNLYGPNDNFDANNSHVLPALIRKFHLAARDGDNTVPIWGSGTPKREFLHVDDLADACLHFLALPPEQHQAAISPMASHINIGTGVDLPIAELAHMIAKVTGFKGQLSFDASKPDGTPRKCMDVSLAQSLGWQAQINLEQGLQQTYDWFLQNRHTLRGLDL